MPQGDYALVSNVPTAADPFHIALEVDRSSGLVVNASCRQGLDTENRHFVTWPIGVSKYLNARFKGLPRVPAYANGCTPMAPLAPPRILSPPPNQRVMLIEGMATQRQAIPLIAEFHSQVHDLRWFVNGKHVGQDQANRQVWWVPKRGRHELVVMDTLGRSTRQTLTVQ
jgi:membrane carboxypeptidase/penicillin-binding protein PbpC